MAFNVQITRIGDHTNSSDRAAKSGKKTQKQLINQNFSTGLVNVPADRAIGKYPVRIFEVQTEG